MVRPTLEAQGADALGQGLQPLEGQALEGRRLRLMRLAGQAVEQDTQQGELLVLRAKGKVAKKFAKLAAAKK